MLTRLDRHFSFALDGVLARDLLGGMPTTSNEGKCAQKISGTVRAAAEFFDQIFVQQRSDRRTISLEPQPRFLKKSKPLVDESWTSYEMKEDRLLIAVQSLVCCDGSQCCPEVFEVHVVDVLLSNSPGLTRAFL